MAQYEIEYNVDEEAVEEVGDKPEIKYQEVREGEIKKEGKLAKAKRFVKKAGKKLGEGVKAAGKVAKQAKKFYKEAGLDDKPKKEKKVKTKAKFKTTFKKVKRGGKTFYKKVRVKVKTKKGKKKAKITQFERVRRGVVGMKGEPVAPERIIARETRVGMMRGTGVSFLDRMGGTVSPRTVSRKRTTRKEHRREFRAQQPFSLLGSQFGMFKQARRRNGRGKR